MCESVHWEICLYRTEANIDIELSSSLFFFVLRQGFINEPRAHHLAMIVNHGSPGPLFSALSLCAEVPGTRYHTWFYVCTELSTEILMLVQRARSLLSHLSPQLVLNSFSLTMVPDHCLSSHAA